MTAGIAAAMTVGFLGALVAKAVLVYVEREDAHQRMIESIDRATRAMAYMNAALRQTAATMRAFRDAFLQAKERRVLDLILRTQTEMMRDAAEDAE